MNSYDKNTFSKLCMRIDALQEELIWFYGVLHLDGITYLEALPKLINILVDVEEPTVGVYEYMVLCT